MLSPAFLLGEELTPQSVARLFVKAQAFNDGIRLNENVRACENMYIGRQWEGLRAEGLPAVQMNFLRRVISFKTASLCADSVTARAEVLRQAGEANPLRPVAEVVNGEFAALTENCRVPRLMRRFCEETAVRGDGCLYVYWDPSADSGAPGGARGAIACETLRNTHVYFGNTAEPRVQKQPYILIRSELPLFEAREKARRAGLGDRADTLSPDSAPDTAVNDPLRRDDTVTVLLLLWRQDGEIYAAEYTRELCLRPPTALGLRLYPLVWMNWQRVSDCYHGCGEAQGLLPNQLAYNRAWSAVILSLLSNAWPRVLYDPTRIRGWDNRVGAVMKAPGGDVEGAAKILQGAPVPAQVLTYLQGFEQQTRESMGVTDAALGAGSADNASAILALQKAASTPLELIRLDLYDAMEDLYRIFLDFMAAYYGVRSVETGMPAPVAEAFAFAAEADGALSAPGTITMPFDFATLRDTVVNLRVDAGAGSYWSEVATVQALDNLLKAGAITPAQYLRRVPAGLVPERDSLIAELEGLKNFKERV